MENRKYDVVYMPTKEGRGTIVKYRDGEIIEYEKRICPNPKDRKDLFVLAEYNPDLQNAIYEMREEDKFHVDEYVFLTHSVIRKLEGNRKGSDVKIWDELFQITAIDKGKVALISEKTRTKIERFKKTSIKKATEEELIEYFSNKTNNKMNNAETVKIREDFLREAYTKADFRVRADIDFNVNWGRRCTVEFILQQHQKTCDEWKKRIENEFPEIFKKDDIAIPKGVFSNFSDKTLNEFCNKAGLDYDSIQIIHDSATKPEYKNRGLYIPPTYKAEVNETFGGGIEIILKHR